jgi:hypothetical protein
VAVPSAPQPLDPRLVAILARVSGFSAGWRREAFAREVVDALRGEGWEIVRQPQAATSVAVELQPEEQTK